MSEAPTPSEAPDWFLAMVADLPTLPPSVFRRSTAPPGTAPRRAAVLILLGEGEHGPDVLLTERAATLRAHAGQVSFPGGGIDPDDDGPVGAALREAVEETGLDLRGVVVGGTLPSLYLSVSSYEVTPVLAWWAAPSEVAPVDAAEVARVVRVPLRDLTHPDNRLRVALSNGYLGPAYAVHGLTVWGFTAGVLTWLLSLTGWSADWEHTRVERLSDLTPVPFTPSGAPDVVEGTR